MKKYDYMQATNMAINRLINLLKEQEKFTNGMFSKCLDNKSNENEALYFASSQIERKIIESIFDVFDQVPENDMIKSLRATYTSKLSNLDRFEDAVKNGIKAPYPYVPEETNDNEVSSNNIGTRN